MSKVFNYVIARPWPGIDPEDSLDIYMFMNILIHRGTMKSAEELLSLVKKNTKDSCRSDKYLVYKVKFKALI